ncbi:hypothetical protein AALO_G00016670, partial [Alosa alosa]
LRFETETRILQPSSLIPTANVTQTGNESSSQTHSSPASGSLSGNSPDGVPDTRHTDTLNSAAEEGNANLTQHSADDPPVDTEAVERCSTEPETKNISTETEPHSEQREEDPVIASEPSLTSPSCQEQSDNAIAEDAQTGRIASPLPSPTDLADVSQIHDKSPTVTDIDHVESTDSVSEQDHNTSRRSERQRRAPGTFTYPQLGKPLISFAQTILESFNKVLVETFEGNPSHQRQP